MIGAKAESLVRLGAAGFRVPPFFVVESNDSIASASLSARCAKLTRQVSDARFAVRSSAAAEDGVKTSFAGMFETFLFVAVEDVADRIERVRRSGMTPRVRAYAAAHGVAEADAPAAIVQVMIDADVSGVAFGRDPVDGSDRVVIACAYGLGAGIVGGDCDTDTFRIDAQGSIVASLARKTLAHRRAETIAGTSVMTVAPDRVAVPSVDDVMLREIDATVRAIGERCGAPQDVEWAIADRKLYILQSRPVTTPAGTLWDNSNIAESYGGIVSPLTFSFARFGYAGAYRQFMRMLAIPERTIAAHAGELDNMLGLIDGRMYYDLLNWYRLLALIPGFRLNRGFMETMMGVSQALPAQTVRSIERTGRANDAVAVVGTLAALVRQHRRLDAAIVDFHKHLAAVLAASPAIETLTLGELDTEFSRLERCLLGAWETPLANDFFAMVWYGMLRRLCARWCGDVDGSVHNDLLCAEGGMISAEPAQRVSDVARLCRGDDALVRALSDGNGRALTSALDRRPDVVEAIAAYTAIFGDRCQSELKLEASTLHDDPRPLYRAIARLAAGENAHELESTGARGVRAAAERQADALLRKRPLQRFVFHFVRDQARKRIRDRENLRYERTRVFGRVRRIFVAIGNRLCAQGRIAEPRDVFLLELSEIRRAIADPTMDLITIVAARRQTYEVYAATPSPPGRFTAIGAHAPAPRDADDLDQTTQRSGIGCCPGVVRGRVRIVQDPDDRFERGEILVAERTDPGWIVLFPAAAGILVERGSVLSHAAIVSRELGIPSVVAIDGLTRWLRAGDLVEFDGRSGRVTRLETSAAIACAAAAKRSNSESPLISAVFRKTTDAGRMRSELGFVHEDAR